MSSAGWSFAVSPMAVCVGFLLWAFASWLCYAQWDRRGRSRRVGALESLRLVILTLLLLTLFRPEWVRLIQRTDPPVIAVLEDASASMTTRDMLSGTESASRTEWLRSQDGSPAWARLQASAKVAREVFSPPPRPAGTNVASQREEGTDLASALENALLKHRNTKAVLILTDGDWNLGRNPVASATRFRAEEVPIFAVAVGRETAMPDLIFERVLAPAYGLLGERVALPFKIASHLGREVRTSVQLFRDGREEARKEIVIPPLGSVEEAILWSPREAGEFSLSVKLPVEPEESLRQNNEQTLKIAIRSEKLSVLVVDSLPRWEYRFLRNALERDPGVEMQCLLFHPALPLGAGRRYLAGFPGTKELLSQFDVVFLGDVGLGEGELTERDAEFVKGLVEQQGSGLVILPGRRGRAKTLLDGPLKNLSPVILDEAKSEGVTLQNEANLLLTPSGRAHWLTRFDADENRNDEIWRGLPGFFWNASVAKGRPGSEVLAVHSSLRNAWGRIPLLVTRPYGNGKVLFMGTDSAWRWRRGVEDKYHYRFWGQVVRWMSHQRHLADSDGVRIVYSPETPRAGDVVMIQATIMDLNGAPVEKGPVVGILTSPSGKTERVEFSPVEGGWGVFKGSFTPQEGGRHALEVSAERHQRRSKIGLTVSLPTRERLGQPANYPVLREISSITRGTFGTPEDLEKLLQQILLLPEPKPLEQRIKLWSHPAWGGFLLALLALYWAGRKLSGLI